MARIASGFTLHLAVVTSTHPHFYCPDPIVIVHHDADLATDEAHQTAADFGAKEGQYRISHYPAELTFDSAHLIVPKAATGLLVDGDGTTGAAPIVYTAVWTIPLHGIPLDTDYVVGVAEEETERGGKLVARDFGTDHARALRHALDMASATGMPATVQTFFQGDGRDIGFIEFSRDGVELRRGGECGALPAAEPRDAEADAEEALLHDREGRN